MGRFDERVIGRLRDLLWELLFLGKRNRSAVDHVSSMRKISLASLQVHLQDRLRRIEKRLGAYQFVAHDNVAVMSL